MTDILEARFPDEADVVRRIFREYADGLGVDLCFQGFDEELALLPGRYAAPTGRVLLAWYGGRVVGCVAMRPLADGDCEMKRLYVHPEGRGQRLGERLAVAICRVARDAGYRRMLLDTLVTMTAARRVYAGLGFEPIDAYTYNPLPGVQYMALTLPGWTR